MAFTPHPGTNLSILLTACSVPVDLQCGCEHWIGAMNDWGVEGCRLHKADIIQRLRDARKERMLSLIPIVYIGVLMIYNGMRPSMGDLVDRAIQEAEKCSGQSG